MDRQLKARLIGAAVLVAIVVLLVPELLTGRKPSEPAPVDLKVERGTRSVTIELGGRPGITEGPPPERPLAPSVVTGQPAEKVVRDSSSPVPSDQEPPPTKDAPTDVVETEPMPVPAPAPVEPPAATQDPAVAEVVTPDRGGWAVQVGAFSAPASARKLVQELESVGYRAFVSPVKRAGKELHRVRVGPEADRAGAERLAAKLKDRGLPAAVVAND